MRFDFLSKIFTAPLIFLFLTISTLLKAQSIYTVAGNGYNGNIGDGGLAVCAGTPYTYGVWPDSKGNLYITCINSIRKVDLTTGIITTYAGSNLPGHTGDGGPALNSTLFFPYDLCMDKKGNLFIAQWDHLYGIGNYIRKINTNTGIITTIAGNGSEGFSGDGGPSINAVIDGPEGICTDTTGNVYFCDHFNKRIRKINSATGIITTIAGNGSDYSGDGGLALNAGITNPTGICIDGLGNLYFTENLPNVSERIRKINSATGIITTVAGNNNNAYTSSGDGGLAIYANLLEPGSLAVDSLRNLYVAEYVGSRIRKIDAATGIINTIAGAGIEGFAGDGGPATNSVLYNPRGMRIDNNGDLYIADNFNNRVRKISSTISAMNFTGTSINITATATTICPSTPVSFTANIINNGGGGYSWQVNGKTVSTAGANYTSSTLKNGDAVTCTTYKIVCGTIVPIISNTLTITYGGGPALNITISATDTTICTGGNVIFTADAKNAGTSPAYQWKLNGSNAGTNTSIYSSSSFKNGDKINCVITPDPNTSCGSFSPISSDTITMIVSTSLSPLIIVIPSDTSICTGTLISLKATTQNAGTTPFYQWKLNGNPVGSNTSTFSANNFLDSDVITCEVTATGLCYSRAVSSPVIIHVDNMPVVSISPNDTLVARGSQIQLQASISGNISSFEWISASGLINPAILNPLTRPVNTITEFQLKVISSKGCTSIAKSIIRISTALFMPSAFSPNGDGLNDIFRIPDVAQLQLKEFSVYDCWGNKIFTTTDRRKGWDGKYKGILMSLGVYVFIISGTDNQQKVFQKGTVTLIL